MLKHKSIWKCLILMITLLIGSSVNSYASIATGYFDQMEDGTIIGWGWDPATPNTAVPVHVTVTNQQTSEIVGDFTQTAAIMRADLLENAIGNGSHGFRIQMDWNSLPDGTYLIEGWSGDQKLPNTQTYTKGAAPIHTDEIKSESVPVSRMHSLGVFRTTAYCPCQQCSEGWGRHTCTGAIAQANHTIAVDPRVIPYGSKVMIGGVVYTAEDRGGAVRGNHVDIFFDTHAQTRQHGTQSQEVFLLQ